MSQKNIKWVTLLMVFFLVCFGVSACLNNAPTSKQETPTKRAVKPIVEEVGKPHLDESSEVLKTPIWKPSRQDANVTAPRLDRPFGAVVEVTGTFVEKTGTYFAQNIVQADYLFQVRSVNGESLKEPVVMNPKVPVQFDYKPGKKRTLFAYETVMSFGFVPDWDIEIQQFNYELIHWLVMSDEKKELSGVYEGIAELKPRLAKEFGLIFTIEGEIHSGTSELCKIKVHKVNGKYVGSKRVLEVKLNGTDCASAGVNKYMAYEDIETSGTPKPFDGVADPYKIKYKIVMKPFRAQRSVQ